MAKQDASVEAIRQLYDAGELNDKLLPITAETGEGEDEEPDLQEEKKIVGAGTIQRKQKYQIQVKLFDNASNSQNYEKIKHPISHPCSIICNHSVQGDFQVRGVAWSCKQDCYFLCGDIPI